MKTTFNLSPENFVHSVRVLLLGYVLVSANDPPENQWCTLEGAMAHIDAAEHYSRLDSITGHSLHSRIMQIEMTIRIEWARACQYEPDFSLSDAIQHINETKTVSRHKVYPEILKSENIRGENWVCQRGKIAGLKS